MSTINYTYPVSGTVAPTAAQIVDLSMLTAQILFADADTVATVVHNMAVSGYGAGFQFPISQVRYTTAPSTTAAVPPLTVVNTDSNTVVVGKLAETGSACTVAIVIQRPNTVIQ